MIEWTRSPSCSRQPERLAPDAGLISPPATTDVVVDIEWSGISTGTERLLWSGRMPHFPGMGYPLVPGYESVGRVSRGRRTLRARASASTVFVPGARCFGEVRGLFGGAAARLVVAGRAHCRRSTTASASRRVLLALAATAYHAPPARHQRAELIVGHGVLGRLLARLALALAAATPVVWERNPDRAGGGARLPGRRSRRAMPGATTAPSTTSAATPALLDTLIARLAPGGEVVLAGFYERAAVLRLPAGLHARGAHSRRRRMAAEPTLPPCQALIATGALSLDGLITHRRRCAARRATPTGPHSTTRPA